MFDFVGKRPWFFLLSALIIIVGLISLGVGGAPLGIDFTSGILLGVEFGESVTQEQLEERLSRLGHDEATIQNTGGNSFLIRITELEEGERSTISKALDEMGAIGEPSFDLVSDPVAKEKARGAVIAVIIAAIGILLYISWAFRKLPNPFRYGTCAIIALVHDVLIVMAVFAILGKLLNLEINLMFITGLLTVIGYSVNNTIVVFDRIRENLIRGYRQNFETVVNNSLIETIGRSLNTSLTTLIILVAIYLFVGVAIRSFILVLLVGVVAGTYSSLLIAGQLLVVWETRKLGKFIR
jgi:preprotein translocase subunit SecF